MRHVDGCFFKRDDPDVRTPELTDEELGLPPRRRRIRCPRCGWRPRPSDRWYCVCLCAWNTFETGGVCPQCHRRWDVTQCLRCGTWSPHRDWYAPDE